MRKPKSSGIRCQGRASRGRSTGAGDAARGQSFLILGRDSDFRENFCRVLAPIAVLGERRFELLR